MENLLNSASTIIDQLAKILNTTSENIVPVFNNYMEIAINQKLSLNIALIIVSALGIIISLIIIIIIMVKNNYDDNMIICIFTSVLISIACIWICVNSIIVINNLNYYIIEDIINMLN